MTVAQKMKQKHWEQLKELELETAQAGLSPELVQRLVKSYDTLELDTLGLNLLKRVGRHGVDKASLLHILIERLLERGDYRLLSAACETAMKTDARPFRLRVALGRAFDFLNQANRAVAEWKALLSDTKLFQKRDWEHLAHFLAGQGAAAEELRAPIQRYVNTSGTTKDQSVARYCWARILVELDFGRVREELTGFPMMKIDDAQIALDIAVLAYRVWDPELARAAAERALALQSEGSLGRSVLDTIKVASGEKPDLTTTIRVPPSMRIHLNHVVKQTPINDLAWGYISSRRESPHPTLLPIQPVEDRGIDLPEDDNTVVTFSVLSAGADPFEILPYVDWSVPHVMFRRIHNPPIMEAFIGSMRGSAEWGWTPARIVSGDDDTAPRPDSAEGLLLWRSAIGRLESRRRAVNGQASATQAGPQGQRMDMSECFPPSPRISFLTATLNDLKEETSARSAGNGNTLARSALIELDRRK